MKEAIEIQITIAPDVGETDAELMRLARSLQKEVQNLNVDQITLARNAQSAVGSKNLDAISWGTLLVTFVTSQGVAVALIGLLQHWLSRQERRTITLEINGDKLEITGVSSETQQKLIDEWLQRHKLIVTPK